MDASATTSGIAGRRSWRPIADAPARAIARYQDFFTTGECRDLLFPAQDRAIHHRRHQGGPGIGQSLNFVGFEDAPYGEYAKRFPDDEP